MNELIPCPDGTMAAPEIGCVSVPDAIIHADTSILEIILKTAEGLLSLAGILAIIMIIWGAGIYSLSAGDKSKAEEAKKILFWSVIGLAVAVLSKSLVAYILSIITQ